MKSRVLTIAALVAPQAALVSLELSGRSGDFFRFSRACRSVGRFFFFVVVVVATAHFLLRMSCIMCPRPPPPHRLMRTSRRERCEGTPDWLRGVLSPIVARSSLRRNHCRDPVSSVFFRVRQKLRLTADPPPPLSPCLDAIHWRLWLVFVCARITEPLIRLNDQIETKIETHAIKSAATKRGEMGGAGPPSPMSEWSLFDARAWLTR